MTALRSHNRSISRGKKSHQLWWPFSLSWLCGQLPLPRWVKKEVFLEVEEFVRKEKLTQRKPERVMESGIKAF